MERDPFLEKLFESPERVAKLHLMVTIGYIIFIGFMVIGILVVILYYLDII